jgi:hypothetical protein
MDCREPPRSSWPQRALVNVEMPQQAFSLVRSERTSNRRNTNRIREAQQVT